MGDEQKGRTRPKPPTVLSSFPLEFTLAVFAGWLCTALGVLGVPAEYEALFIRGLLYVALVLSVGVPIIWRQKHITDLLRYAETDGLYGRLDDAAGRDLHDTYLRLSQIQWTLNGLTREYHVKEHDLWIADQLQQRDEARVVKDQLRELQGDMVLQYSAYDWEILSICRRLEQRGFSINEELVAALNKGCHSVADIDGIAEALHSVMEDVGPHAW